ncbi:hypothetical protein AB3M83_04455 [Microbacterium sp. 179-B 1A2 NHS]|uniref:hypothetical protein n=1 Tax=Microbacterium sp. 179-B 1A2 NHS TaxID=3142383 RepID=UPI0039A3859B
MTISAPVPVTAQRAWGIAAVVIGALALIPTVLVLILAATVSPDFGWFSLITIPATAVGGVLAALAGVVGIVYARLRRRAYAWPVAGIVLGGLLAVATALIFTPLAFL